jgi:hypothetical protein
VSADDALKAEIDRVLDRETPARKPVVLPASTYDHVKALGWDVRGYTRGANPKRDFE